MSSVSKIGLIAAVLAGLSMTGPLCAAVSKPLNSRDAQAYASAMTDAEKGNWKSAYRRAGRIKDKLPTKLLRWMEMSRHGTNQSFAAISGFIANNPDWPRRGSLRRRAEENLTPDVAHADVIKWFETYPPLTSDGRIRQIEAVVAGGTAKQARALIRDAWINGNFGRKQETGFRRKYRKYLTKADHVARLDRLLWDGQTTRARRALRLVDSDTQKLAMARIALRASRGGVDWHIRQVPKELLNDPGLVFERARWRRRKGLDDGAYDLLKNVPSSAPFARKWWVERSILARRLLAKGHISEAYRLAKANGLSSGARYVEAEWLAGWIALRHLDDPKVAHTHFSRIGEKVSYPISRARAAYWAGRAAEAVGDRKGAETLFQTASLHDTTYYGQLAAARNNGNAPLRSAKVNPTAADVKAFERDERVRSVRILSQIGARDHIRPFLDSLTAETENPVRQVLTARLATAIGRRDLAVRVGRKAYRMGSPLPDIAYPVISMTGDRPEQALLHAIVRQESNFEQTAVSHAGARGLMQLMPRTAKGVAKRLRVRFSKTRLTSDAGYNIKLGQAYLGQMLTRFDGSYILAIASYNAGPSAAARWVREFGDPREPGVDVIDWVESIPYRETRNYVQRVMENLQVYRSRLGGPTIAEGIVRDLER